MNRTLLVAAGGTGGHIFPALAIAECMLERGWKVVWLGSPNGMEVDLVMKHGIQIEFIHFSGVRGKNLRRKLLFPFHFLRALWESARVLYIIRPDVVLGMGGYITFPIGIMTKLKGIPLVLHEQNSIAGLSNYLLAKLANHVLVAFPNVLPSAVWTGNPIRRSLITLQDPLKRYGNRLGPLCILVVGGSLGASILNEKVPQALSLLKEHIDFRIIHQAGVQHIDALKENYEIAGFRINDPSIHLVSFIEDMSHAYGNADVVICRSGAMTVSEIAAVGIAALFIPFPFAVDDHQTHNARFLVNNGAAAIIQQHELSAEQLFNWLINHDRAMLSKMAIRAYALAKLDATDQIADVCEACVKHL